MGTAVLNPAPVPPPPAFSEPDASPEALRTEAAARIAAHKQRRERIHVSHASPQDPRSAPAAASEPASSAAPPAPNGAAEVHKSRIAQAVADRYAQAQSYRAFLAAEAERAVQQARAAAEIAARNAQAIAEAQQQLLAALDHAAATPHSAGRDSSGPGTPIPDAALVDAALSGIHTAHESLPSQPRGDLSEAGSARDSEPRSGSNSSRSPLGDADALFHPDFAPALRVQLYEDIPTTPPVRHAGTQPPRPTRHAPAAFDPEAYLLDEEISFRQSPVFEEPAGPPEALPANLIEFPRQLVASRKARPRYAEGPLRQEAATQGDSQLRIFEVDPAQIATTPAAFDDSAAATAQWTALWLDTPTLPAPMAATELYATAGAIPDAISGIAPQLYPARWSRRALAAGIDSAIVAGATLTFATAFAVTTAHTGPSPATAWSAAATLEAARQSLLGLPLTTGLVTIAATFAALSVAFQALFFTFADATPGMRLARVGLCTLTDENPTRAAMRRRIPAVALSTLLFGIGFLWALLDEDGLPWHDLISRMYPRSY